MTPHFRLKMLTNFPDWHRHPLRLNRAEIRDPYIEIASFFDRYNLSNFRICLKQWLDDAINDSEADAASHIGTYDDVEKLVEAVWVLFEQKGLGAKEAPPDSWEEDGATENNPDNETGDEQRFVKRPRLWAYAKTAPLDCIKEVFKIIDLDDLNKLIERWLKIALATGEGNYSKGVQRADLMDFCEGLHRLIEITYTLHCKRTWDTEGRVKRRLRESLKYELLTVEQSFRLTEEEIADPGTVLDGFFAVFSLQYARAEVWELLDTVVAFEQMGGGKIDLLLEYECLRALLEAAWIMHRKAKEEDTGDQEIQNKKNNL